MTEPSAFQHHNWDAIPAEVLKGTITRKLVTGDSMMIAQVFLKKGDDVPLHSHHNEQLTYILSGALKFWLGEERREVIVRAGEVLVIPPHLTHEALALEDTLDVDVFSPPREDWLNKTDDYLRKDA
jgi:quercetin dioxygenase-like cupin family protein